MNLNPDLALKLAKFKSDTRSRVSLLILFLATIVTLPAEFLCNVRPLLLVVDGRPYFPILFTYSEKDFGGSLPSEPDYKSDHFIKLLSGGIVTKTSIFLNTKAKLVEGSLELGLNDFEDETAKNLELKMGDFEDIEFGPKKNKLASSLVLELSDFQEKESTKPQKTNSKPTVSPSKPIDFWMIWPPIPYDYKYIPTQSRSGVVALAAPYERKTSGGVIPSSFVDSHYLGTDDRGRDVLARLIYGFRISIIFGLFLAITGTLLGCLIGGTQGYFGGWIDLIGQRFTEIWGSMPRLYLLIILSSFLVPSALLLFVILNLTAWMGIAAYIRAEFLKSRNLEYVKAARAMGVSDFEIMCRHILPNSLTPVITFFPFEVTAGILALVSLDYLNLGVPSPSPSLGELLAQGKNNLQATWIILPTFLTLTTTLTILTFVGEGVRNAFDPRKSLSSDY